MYIFQQWVMKVYYKLPPNGMTPNMLDPNKCQAQKPTAARGGISHHLPEFLAPWHHGTEERPQAKLIDFRPKVPFSRFEAKNLIWRAWRCPIALRKVLVRWEDDRGAARERACHGCDSTRTAETASTDEIRCRKLRGLAGASGGLDRSRKGQETASSWPRQRPDISELCRPPTALPTGVMVRYIEPPMQHRNRRVPWPWR
jgi:hypothetical protein